MKRLLMLLLLLLPLAEAANIALIVKNSASLDYVHEYRINRVLREMGHSVTLIDKTNYQNYDFNSFDAIVIAGRPSNVYASELLDDFVASLPVNSKPSVVIDSSYPDDFGWIQPGAIGTVFSSSPIYINVVDNSTMLSGFPVDSRIRTHIIGNQPVLNIELTRSVLNTSASLPSSNLYSVIAYAEPGTLLLNNNITSSRIVFFGITEPLYWTDEAELMFKNSVNWVLHSEFIMPTQPFMGEYNLLQINIYNDGSRQFLVDLGKDGIYEKYWDPTRGIVTNLYRISDNVYAIDVDSDGKYDYIYDSGFLRGLPDLMIESINFENEPVEGGVLKVKIISKNIGNSIARNFNIVVMFDSILLETRSVSNLEAGQNYTVNIEIMNIPKGQHEIKAIIDQENNVFERDESNNQMTKTYVISYQLSSPTEVRRETTTTVEEALSIREQGEINITLPNKVELLQGEKVSVDIRLYNPLNYSIYDIYPLVYSDGLNANWYAFEPKEVKVLQPNEEGIIRMQLSIPEDAGIYTYKILLKFPSKSDYGTKTYTKTMYLQIKERPKHIEPIEPTTTTLLEKQPTTGLAALTFFKWTAVIVGLMLLAIVVWFYYPRIRKSGYIIGKGWRHPKGRRYF
jgi:hypothetical protein